MASHNYLSKYSFQGRFAWPTVFVFVFAISMFVASTYAGLNQLWPVWLSVLANGIAAFLAFTVLHEASHSLVSKFDFLNDVIGQIAMFLLTPAIGFNAYRDVHHYHHLHTNHSVDKDPDFWLSTGPKYGYPLKWMMMDSYYFYFYVRHMMANSKASFLNGLIVIASILGLVAVIYTNSWEREFFVYSFVPSRLASIYLIWSFAYLPHKPHQQTQDPNPINTTNVFTGFEAWLTPMFMGHNFHLIHHLQPNIPFYRYRQAWENEKLEIKVQKVKVFHHFKHIS